MAKKRTTRRCRFGKVKSGARKGLCRKRRIARVSRKPARKIRRKSGTIPLSSSKGAKVAVAFHDYGKRSSSVCAPSMAAARREARKHDFAIISRGSSCADATRKAKHTLTRFLGHGRKKRRARR